MSKPYPTELSQLAQKNGPMVCHGCAHSAGGASYPGHPSGERPCCFCTRNVQREEWIKDGIANGAKYFGPDEYGKKWTPRYDNGPVAKVPLDCYIATDYLVEVVSKMDR